MAAASPIHINYKLTCPCFPLQQAPAATAPVVDASKVANWIRKVDEASPRFARIAENGSFSLLAKEIEDITPLLSEGQELLTATSPFAPALDMINTLARPRVAQLQQIFTNAQKKIADKPDGIEEDAKLAKKWNELGLPASILEHHIDCARFLKESGLAFAIVGYRETCGNADLHDVKLDRDGMPMIKVQGNFKRWDQIKQELVYDEKTYQVRSRAYPGSIVQNWTYLSPAGLVPIDRLYNDRIVPIYQITPQERQRVVAQANKFYETNREVDQGIPKDWVVQFHTSPRRAFVASLPPLPETPLLDNLARNLNTHIVMRLIAPNGEVYSFGVEMPAESQEFLWEGNMAKLMATVTARINKAGDYEEFRTHSGRYVTSIPLTAQRAENILNLVNSTGDIRFQFLRQNCAPLMNIVMKMSGYDVPTESSVKEFFADILPNVKDIPVIGPVIHKINEVFGKVFSGIASVTPEPIKNVVSIGWDAVFYIPRKMATLCANLLIKYLGGSMMLHSLPPGTQEDELYNAGRFLNFSSIIRSWTDLFKEQTQELYHSKHFIEWQKQQRSTFLEPRSDRPKLAIVPPAA